MVLARVRQLPTLSITRAVSEYPRREAACVTERALEKKLVKTLNRPVSLSVKKRVIAVTQSSTRGGDYGGAGDTRAWISDRNSRPCYVPLVGRFFISLSLSLSLSLGIYIADLDPYFSIVSLAHHSTDRGFRGPSTPTGRPRFRRRRHRHCRPTQKGRAALYTMSIYLRQIQ